MQGETESWQNQLLNFVANTMNDYIKTAVRSQACSTIEDVVNTKLQNEALLVLLELILSLSRAPELIHHSNGTWDPVTQTFHCGFPTSPFVNLTVTNLTHFSKYTVDIV